jgi:hypothetical protein
MAVFSPESPASPTMRRRIGRSILVIGNLLMVATFFMPWLELETIFCSSGPRCGYHYGPWYLIQPGVPSYPFLSLTDPFLQIIACGLVILACSTMFLISQNQKAQRFALGVLFVLCGVCVIITAMTMIGLPFALTFSDLDYNATIAYGSWLALVSFIGIFAAAILVWPE